MRAGPRCPGGHRALAAQPRSQEAPCNARRRFGPCRRVVSRVVSLVVSSRTTTRGAAVPPKTSTRRTASGGTPSPCSPAAVRQRSAAPNARARSRDRGDRGCRRDRGRCWSGAADVGGRRRARTSRVGGRAARIARSRPAPLRGDQVHLRRHRLRTEQYPRSLHQGRDDDLRRDRADLDGCHSPHPGTREVGQAAVLSGERPGCSSGRRRG